MQGYSFLTEEMSGVLDTGNTVAEGALLLVLSVCCARAHISRLFMGRERGKVGELPLGQRFQKNKSPTVLVDYLREHKGLAVPPAERIFLTGNAPPAGNGDEGGNSDPENSHSLPVLVVLCVLGLGVLVLSLLAIILLRRSSASSFARLQEPQEGGNAV